METPKGLFWQTMKVQMKRHKCSTVFYDKILSSGTEVCNNLKISTCEPLEYIMNTPILLACICMGKSIRIQRINANFSCAGPNDPSVVHLSPTFLFQHGVFSTVWEVTNAHNKSII